MSDIIISFLRYGGDGRIVCVNCGIDIRPEVDAIMDKGGDGEEVAMRVNAHVAGECRLAAMLHEGEEDDDEFDDPDD